MGYRDPDGAFEIGFPVEPEVDENVQAANGRSFVMLSLTATTPDGDVFSLAWSDSPAGTPLVRTQTIKEQIPEENAERDGGEVVDEHEVTLFGRPGLEFAVDGHGDSGFYYDVHVMLGGRLYELNVIRGDDDRAAFDQFVESFHLLRPPLADDADFFATAEGLCAAAFNDRPGPDDDATPAERGAAVSEVADLTEDIANELARTPATALDQGDAAALIDAMHRSIDPARTFADAVAADAPNAPDLGQATHADTDLVTQLSEANGAPSCG